MVWQLVVSTWQYFNNDNVITFIPLALFVSLLLFSLHLYVFLSYWLCLLKLCKCFKKVFWNLEYSRDPGDLQHSLWGLPLQDSSSVKVSARPSSILMCLLLSAGDALITHAPPSCRRCRFAPRREGRSLPRCNAADLSMYVVMYGVIRSPLYQIYEAVCCKTSWPTVCKRWNSWIFGGSFVREENENKNMRWISRVIWFLAMLF